MLMINLGNDLQVSEKEAQDIVEWFKMPQGKVFTRFLDEQRSTAEERTKAPIGDNPIKDLLMRERNLAAVLAFDSIKNWPLDIDNMLKQVREQEKT